jgi:4-hydroxy-2-oxoheptanedioate aldolase
MELPKNPFKQAICTGRPQIGLWLGLANAYATELLATTGFDWLLIDAEHAPNDTRSVLSQLQVIESCPSHPIVRLPQGDAVLIKQYLDLGAQTLMIPMVETAEQAAQLVRAMRYPPHGIRGVGSALARASRWSQVDEYLALCKRELCLLVQVETVTALQNLEAIAAVEGVDGVFFGPADLAASMGYLGSPGKSAVQDAIAAGIATVKRAGKAPGILTSDMKLARDYLHIGALFVAVGVDTTLLTEAAKTLAASFKGQVARP